MSDESTKSLDYDLREGLQVHDDSMYEPDEVMSSLINPIDFVIDVIKYTYSMTDQWKNRLWNQRRQRMRLS